MTAAWKNQLSYNGVTDATGAPAHVVRVAIPGSGSGPRAFTAHYDTSTLLPRRLDIAVQNAAGATLPTMVEYSDYRSAGGIPVPFRRRVVSRGVRAAADTARTRVMLNALRAGLGRLSGAERERTMRTVTELEGVLDRDEMVTEANVTSAQVNQGPPSGIRLDRPQTLEP